MPGRPRRQWGRAASEFAGAPGVVGQIRTGAFGLFSGRGRNGGGPAIFARVGGAVWWAKGGALRWSAGAGGEPGGGPARFGQAEIELGDQADQGEQAAQGRLEVALVKALKQREGHKEDEHEVEDGLGVVFEAMVQRPVRG